MTALIEAPPYGSEDWLAWRLHGLGSSELPSIVGCDPWRSEYQVAALKRGLTEAEPSNARMAWGHRMESVGLDVYAEQTGTALERGETFGDPRWPHLWATLDGRAGRVGVEVKWTARWDIVPRRVEVQALAQIGLAGLDAVDVVRLSPYGEPAITRIERDEGSIADLLDLGESWYRRYVLGDEMPPLDGSREATRALDRLAGPAEYRADERQTALMDDLRRVRVAQDRLKASEESLVRAIKGSMAGGGILSGESFRVTWVPVKGRTATDWKSIAMGLATRITAEEWDALMSLHTTIGEGTTRFAAKWDEEEIDGG